MKNYFYDIASLLEKNLRPDEHFTASFSGERLDYARFNHAQVRQSGTVTQQFLDLNVIVQKKHSGAQIGLSGVLTEDTQKIASAFKSIRNALSFSEDDPYLMLNETPHSTEHCEPNLVEDNFFVIDQLLEEAQGLDLVGIYTSGPIYKGFANSFGQRNWFETASFIIDTSVYHSGDKAIKQTYCDKKFDRACFKQKMLEARYGLELFDRPQASITPGEYRVYFSPSAVNELISMINWGGFSRKALEVKSSPIMPLWEGKKSLSPMFSLYEHTKAGVGPNFQSQGFIKPDCLPLIEKGVLKNTLISPKTAKEYELDHNGADEEEVIQAISVPAGNLLQEDILSTLENGLFINNLWYLNYSDKHNGCLTGMTRFLCYTVKNGQPSASFSVMRFDDSIYRMFGNNLEALTKQQEMIIDGSTYDERSTSSACIPGMIVNDVKFTL